MKGTLLLIFILLASVASQAQSLGEDKKLQVMTIVKSTDILDSCKSKIAKSFGDSSQKYIPISKTYFRMTYIDPMLVNGRKWTDILKFVSAKANNDKDIMAIISRKYFEKSIKSKLTETTDWNKAISIVKKEALKGDPNWLYFHLALYYEPIFVHKTHIKNSVINFYKVVDQLISTPSFEIPAGQLNGWAWAIFVRCEDKKGIESAIKWSNKAMNLVPDNASYIDTQANLLYKLGEKKQAIELERKAVALSGGVDQEINMALKKMEAGVQTW